ncbi:alpha/beta hydrolase-fold protein [Croceicoccus sp. F390]|uniref:Alpha/beta hydrolase-fold protein n=1 Tax=Croceicoccus esteveae TaxID=3075597 RepID=A0ABU2ZH47_9SPHN|nr:alpha/beta hydrolase-fold protein [Croceicoccus sp. F390]MDT0575923.1 alpha/beta hydrolase-fold protein [Croceicoccus sp. F390]
MAFGMMKQLCSGVAGCALLLVGPAVAEEFTVSLPAGAQPIDGRVLLILTPDGKTEPRYQVDQNIDAPQIFGVDAQGLSAGQNVRIGREVLGFPAEDMSMVPAGNYHVQAVLHKYDTFNLANGKTVQLPAARGAGQNWRNEPGNLFSTPRQISFDPARTGDIAITLDQVNPAIAEPQDTEFVRHFKIRSESLSEFWGTDVFIRGHVLVPRGFDDHPEARYPLMIFHGHFPADFGGFRTTPPDPDLVCEYSERFDDPCYNRVEQQEAYDQYQQWIADDFPRFLVVEIDHSNPYYDDSYAVNSANLGPYGDAITHEFVPALEKEFRGIGEGWARFLYGGSTGGWEALAAQIFYPDEYNGAFAACPDPIDFRQMMVTNIYEEPNAYWTYGPFGRTPKPGKRNYLGHVDYTAEQENRFELVLGDKSRSGAQWDIWEAVYSPMGEDGYPQRIWDKRTGVIDKEVAAHWRENYDLRHIMERDWATLGPKLQGKIHLYVGDMDNFYLNNAVYLTEDFLKKADPPFMGEVAYGDRAEHCWNGDPDLPNSITRLRYNTMYVPRIMKRIEASAPAGADLTSWRY